MLTNVSEKLHKRLVFCFDGTWNRLAAVNPTNVVLLAQMIKPVADDGAPQIVYYDEGIGTDRSLLRRLWDGAVGGGMLSILREAYRFLIFNYEPGDEIFAFGFSRGAYTARSFIGFIRHAGILDVVEAPKIDKAIEIYKHVPAGETGEESSMALRFRARHCRGIVVSEADREFRRRVDPGFDEATPMLDIRHVGVWDTVRALGLPEFLPFSGWFNQRYSFHNAILTSKIQSARHAVALDECRLAFRPTLFGQEKIAELNALKAQGREQPFEPWEMPYQEQWFPGVHGAVGGGGARRGLSDAALQWLLSGAQRAGLDLRSSADAIAFTLNPDPFDEVYNDPPGLIKKLQAAFHALLRIARAGPGSASEIALVTYQRWTGGDTGKAARYAPRSLRHAGALLGGWPFRNPIQTKSEEELEEYTVAKGDWLSRLADDRLGDSRLWPELFALNRDRLDDPEYLPVGLKLRLPRKAQE